MFLNQLNEKEKECFLKLALAMAKSDGVFIEKERRVLKEFSDECGMSIDENAYIDAASLMSILDELAPSSEKVKRIILLELAQMVIIDNNYMYQERKILNVIADHFVIRQEVVDEVVNMYDHYLEMLQILTDFVENGEYNGR